MKRGKYVHLNEALRLMDKFGYLTEANPTHNGGGGFGGGSSGGGGASGTWGNNNNNNGGGGSSDPQGGNYRNNQPAVVPNQSVIPYEGQDDDGVGPQKDRTGSVFWLAMRDAGYHFNEYIKRPIKYEVEGLEGDTVGTVCLIVKDNNGENFRIVIGEEQTLVYQDPNGTVIPMCRIKRGRKRSLNCSRVDEVNRTVNTNRLSGRGRRSNNSNTPNNGGNNGRNSTQGGSSGGSAQQRGGSRTQQGPAMTREKVDPNDENAGGIVKLGKFWLFLKSLKQGAEARLAGVKDGGYEIAEILDDFAAWFAEQEKEAEMPEPNTTDSDFGEYVHQSLLQGGNRVIVADTGQTFRVTSSIQVVNNKQVLHLDAYSGQNVTLGKYIKSECKPTNDGCEGKIYCDNVKMDTYVAFKYLVNLNVVLFHLSIHNNPTNWVQNCQGALVTLIINYYQQNFVPNAQQGGGGNNPQNRGGNGQNGGNNRQNGNTNQANIVAAEQQITNDLNNYWATFIGWNNNMSEVVRGSRIALYAVNQGSTVSYTTYYNGRPYTLGELNSVKMYQTTQGDVLASLIYPNGQLFVKHGGDFAVKYQNGLVINDTDTIQGNFMSIIENGLSMI